MQLIDFDNLPDRQQLVTLIATMNLDETLLNLNVARQRSLDMPEGEELSDDENHASILIARRIRELRATSRSKKAATKKKAADAPLGDLLKGI